MRERTDLYGHEPSSEHLKYENSTVVLILRSIFGDAYAGRNGSYQATEP